jgi:AcrR family transcriptional regulator
VKGQVQARGVQRRQAIVDAAIEHFAQEGYRGTGIAAIAKAAGVTTGGVLHHFGSKEGLLVEVLKERDRRALAAFRGVGTGTAASDLGIWAEVATWNEDRPALTRLYTVLHAESIHEGHPARAYFLERNEVVAAALRRTLQKGVDTGELRPGVDVAAKAAEIQAFLEGAALAWLHDPQPGGLRRLIRNYVNDQVALLRAPGHPDPGAD